MSKGRSLTENQGKFAALVAQGASLTDAYVEAYKSDKMTRNMCCIEGGRVAKIAHVAEAIASMRSDSASGERLRERVTKDWVTRQLQIHALDEDNPAAVRVRSLELLGRTYAMFTDVQANQGDVRSSHMVKEDIDARLRDLLGDDGASQKKKDDARASQISASRALVNLTEPAEA
jgi:hypothetical protein